MRELPHTHSCFVCGESNPFGLRMRFETDGRIVQARFTLRPEHIGFRGTIHGGITATILDEIMVWACAVQTGRFAVCAELNVRYLSPIRPGDAVVATGELAVNRRNKLFEARAELRLQSNAETVLAGATGKYFPIKEADAAELARDFVGEPLMNFGGAA
ncbi:MAG TPA: PaaI family thioesterase [Verrucomicrobiae bacterium]|nr:PaaI family thioesterase [Verrucomicrobiae bacterium]